MRKITQIIIMIFVLVTCMGTISSITERQFEKWGIFGFVDKEDYRYVIKDRAEVSTIESESTRNKPKMQLVYENILDKVHDINEKSIRIPKKIDKTFDEYFFQKKSIINVHGYLQKILGKNYIDDVEVDVVKLSNGQLASPVGKADESNLKKRADDYENISRYLETKNIPFIFVLAPNKIMGDVTLPRGVEDYSNNNSDRFLELLDERNIEYIDLRKEAKKDNLCAEDMFYKTDHHWTTEAGYWAYIKVASYLSSRYGVEFDAKTLSIENYECITYKNSWLGSRGRRVGKCYGGIDDFVFINPLFETNQTIYVDCKNPQIITGDYMTTIAPMDTIENRLADCFTADLYALYMYGNANNTITINNLHNNGVNILFGRDSFGDVLIPYFSLSCNKVFEGQFTTEISELQAYVEENDIDFVIVIEYASNI